MSRKNEGRHAADSPTWSVTRTAKTAVDMRTDVVQSMPGNATMIENYLDTLNSSYLKILGVFLGRGQTRDQARVSTLIEMNMRQEADTLLRAEDPLRLLGSATLETTAASIERAKLYVVSPAMHATIAAACATLTDDDLALWTADDLPSPDGLLVLPRIQHFHYDPASAIPDELIALSWRQGLTYTHTAAGTVDTHDTLFATSWVDRFGPLTTPKVQAVVDRARDNGDPYPTILPLQHSYVELGSEYTTVAKDDDLESIRPSIQQMEGQFSGEAIRGESLNTWVLRYLMAFTRLAQQPKTTRSESFAHGIDSRSKPRPHHDVRVVQLRSYEKDIAGSGDTGGAGSPNYTRRWMVKMHKVNQWHSKEKVHKILWRGPYIKGPEGAPLMAGEKVYALDD